MTNKKIGFICPSKSWGGLEMNVFKLAQWLTDRGWEIILFGHPESLLYEKFNDSNLKTYPVISKSKLHDIFLVKKLASYIKDENIQTVILHITKNLPLAVLAKIISGNYFRLLFMQHMHLGGTKKNIYHKWLYNKLDIWLAPLPIFVEYLSKFSYMNLSKVKVVPFGIELDRFTKYLPEKKTARKELSLPIDATIIGMVGRLDEKKCQHILIEACQIVNEAGYDMHVLLLGDKTVGTADSYSDFLHKMTDEKKINNRVHFRGSIKNIETAYAAMDIFALTTGSETFGMVLVEAMASRLPVIAANEGGPKDIIQHNQNGLLVTPLDSKALANAVIEILKDKTKAQRLASQASIDAVEKYSYRTQCESLETIFNNLNKKRDS